MRRRNSHEACVNLHPKDVNITGFYLRETLLVEVVAAASGAASELWLEVADPLVFLCHKDDVPPAARGQLDVSGCVQLVEHTLHGAFVHAEVPCNLAIGGRIPVLRHEAVDEVVVSPLDLRHVSGIPILDFVRHLSSPHTACSTR